MFWFLFIEGKLTVGDLFMNDTSLKMVLKDLNMLPESTIQALLDAKINLNNVPVC